MFNPKNFDSRRINATALVWDRQFGGFDIDRRVRRRLQTSYIDRLDLDCILRGHEGCVNCLEWNADGRVLASGSDDFQVILWDPFRKKRIYSMRTKHLGNMFSVKFLPRHNDSLIATGAADQYVYVFDVNRRESILSCKCHGARVKRLATAPDSPFLFWSAGEDGTILQLDIREQHRCRSDDNRVRLLNLTTYLDSNAEAKCLAINPRRSEYLAVGANDPYARIYDRRMLRLQSTYSGSSNSNGSGGNGMLINGGNTTDSSAEPNVPKDCVTYYCPGHINKSNSKLIEHETRAITYLTFNATGTELLVNMGGEHVYLYDLLNAEKPVFLSLPDYEPLQHDITDIEMTPVENDIKNMCNTIANNDNSNIESSVMQQPEKEQDQQEATTSTNIADSSSGNGENINSNANIPSHRQKLPENIELYKKTGNEFLEKSKFLCAINQYSEAISLAPESPVLYLNRATAYMRRLWFGDVYASLKDCHTALRLDPSYIKAHFRLARALHELGRAQDADDCLKELLNRFPTYVNNHGVKQLYKNIKESHQTQQTQQQASEGYNSLVLSPEEYHWRSLAKDYHQRFVGHCNTTTDIKEANYFGYHGEYIVAGSDDGNFFIWERSTCKIRAVYKADGAIVNCVQPHPDIGILATSGIDHDVKIWSPVSETPDKRDNLVTCIEKTVEDNQLKMKTDPFDLNPRNSFCWNG